MTDAEIIALAARVETCPVLPWWLKDNVAVGDVRAAVLRFARALLAAAPQPTVQQPAPDVAEPVAYLFRDEVGRTKIVLGKETAEYWCPPGESITPLYAAPQPAEQQPVGEMISDSGDIYWADRHPPMGTKLYTAPQPAPDVEALVEALEWLRGTINATPENDKVQAGIWISSEHPRIKQIDAILAAHRKQQENK